MYTVNSDATLTLEAEAKGKAWARTLRDPIQDRLGMETSPPDLSHLNDETLAAELRARGWSVSQP